MKFIKRFFVLSLFCLLSFSILGAHQTTISSYGDLYHARAHIVYPRSVDELQSLVKKAHRKKQKISIVGRGMSQGKQSLLSNTILINMKHINAMSLEGKVLTVGAGALWSDIQKYINPHALALQVMQGSNIFSVGGSLSVNCHGWDFRQGPILNTIKELTIINSKGDLIHLSPSDPLFYYVIGGYGCFGVITEAKLLLTDNLPIIEISEEIPLTQYIDHFHKHVKNSPEILMHRYRLSLDTKNFFQSGIATNYQKAGSSGVISNLRVNHFREKFIDKTFWFVRKFPFSKNIIYKTAKRTFLRKTKTTRNEVMSPPFQFLFTKQKQSAGWLQEFFIGEDEFEAFALFLKDTLQKNDVLLLNASVRYVKADSGSPLHYSREKNQFAIVLYFAQPLTTKEIQKTCTWVQEIINYLVEHRGVYYLPYQHFATLEQFHACYPDWKTFQMTKEQYDPDLLFLNGFYEDYFLSPQTPIRIKNWL